MQSFIFDYYGYNANIENNEFEYEGYKFLLLSVEDDEKDIIKLNDLVNSLNIHFNSDVVFIVKNKYDKYPNKQKVASITKAQVEEIAKTKLPDLNATSIESAMSMIAGTARSMGITVVD